MTKSFNDNSDVTAISSQVETLKKHFPQCFDKHGAFMPDKLQALVSDNGTEFSKESYSLNWLGKSYARLLANEKPLTFLSENKTHNQKPENKNSENLLIKGDNLEVLKHLKNAYSEQIKMIYIDPPYNTGTDGFVYQDDRKFTVDELSRLAGIDSDEAKRILEFTQSKANSHSAWLTFMYPRLYVARELLKDEGVIFISIDDNEVAQLRILCDEVFGDSNFIANIIWEKKYTRANDAKWFSDNHDHILCYGKVKDAVQLNLLPRNTEQLAAYSNPDNHPKGKWKATPLHAKSGTNTSPYTFDNGITWTPPIGTFRRFNNESMRDMDAQDEIWFGSDGKQTPSRKSFLIEVKDGVTPVTIWKHSEVGHNHEANNELKSLSLNGLFSNPKPVRLIKRAISLICNNKNDIILDFFAGSGTTAHAIMADNAQHNTNRRYILVQIHEVCDKKTEAYKAGYKTIFDITKARIEKAAEKIKIDYPDYQGDLGFKLFKTVPVPQGYQDEYETLNPTAPIFNGSMLSNEQLDDLLTTWKVFDRIPLTTSLTAIDLAGYSAYQHQKILYFIHDGFSSEALVTLLQKIDDTDKEKAFDVERLVLFAHNFDSKHQREIKEAVTKYQNKKAKNISVEFRY
jgi:adenine-specific DNA-methyltransferase